MRNSAVTIFIVMVALISASGLKAFAADSDSTKGSNVSGAGANANKSSNIIVADAIKRGAKKCLGRIESVTDQVLGNATVGAYVVTVDNTPTAGSTRP